VLDFTAREEEERKQKKLLKQSKTMIKAHSKFKTPTMRRASRIFLNDLNKSKAHTLKSFLYKCHDITQYFVDLFWASGDRTAKLANLEIIHKGRDRFNTTTRLSQALAKQAKEIIRDRMNNRKPRLRKHTVTLYYHFVTIEKFNGVFDYAIKLIGSGAPIMVIPVKSTGHLNRKLKNGWTIGKSIRLGLEDDQLFVDFILEKPIPSLRMTGKVLGMDSNYKHGMVFSDGRMVGEKIYDRIQEFGKRQKHTHIECRNEMFKALNEMDLSDVRMIAVENLKNVKRRGKFSRVLNRRMSHWLYAYVMDWLSHRCEELGIRLEKKDPWKTSQRCPVCGRWDRRNRRGDEFICVHCGHIDQADLNASKNLECLGLAGVYGLRLLPSSE
jgi:IS605 OrfB family transposase